TKEMALAAYRQLLRSTRVAFQGDEFMLNAARAQARSAFDQNRSLSSGSEEAQKSVDHAGEVAKVLRENVVQGRSVEDGRYRLRIHEYTELGDNETVKTAGQRNKLTEKCSS
ncbi:mitochondrial zinc maintenance protein 1, mitochondrial, partial [Lineolata rhizophorae]